MRKSIFIAALIATAVFVSNALAIEFRRCETFEDVNDASFLVVCSNAAGTGAFVGYDSASDMAIIMTNYHVVTTNKTAKLYSWKNFSKAPLDAVVLGKYYNANRPADNCLLGVNAQQLKDALDPPYIQLGGRDAAPTSNAKIISAGCPDGRFVQTWKGAGSGYYNGKTFEFVPPPVPGQSGSAIVEKVGGSLWYVGTLTWRIGDSKGGAVPLKNFYDEYYTKTSYEPTSTNETLLSIPPDAVECASDLPTVLYFRRDNCAACETVANKIDELKELANVQMVDTATAQGRDLMQCYGVSKVPTFIGVDDKNIELWRIVGGSSKTVENIKNNLAQFAQPNDETKTETNETETETNETNAAEIEPISAPVDIAQPVPVDDFRNRPRIWETSAPVGLFDDSCRLWNNRRQCPPDAPSCDANDDGKTKDDGDAGLIFGRENNNNSFDKFADKIERRIEEKAKDKFDELKKDAAPRVKQFIITACKCAFYIALVACLSAQIIGSILGRLFQRLFRIVKRTFFIFVEDFKTFEGTYNVVSRDDKGRFSSVDSSDSVGNVDKRKRGTGSKSAKKSGAK